MTDLNQKFVDLTDQLALWHSVNTDQLTAILSALGGAPTDTFAALTAAVNATNTLLASIRSDNTTHYTALFNLIDTMNNNASLNAQRILATLLQTACPCDDTVPLLPPTLGTTPIDATSVAKCQRVQYFIDLFRTWVIAVGQYVGQVGSISSFQVNSILQSQLADRSITTGQLYSGISISSRDTISSLLNNAASAYTAPVVDSTLFNAMIVANIVIIRQALYGTDSAVDGKSSFDDIVNTMSIPSWAVVILRVMFYSSWANDLYSATPIVDASAYDGDICAPSEPCHTFSTEFVTANIGYGNEGTYAAAWPSQFIPSTLRPDGLRNWSLAVFAKLPIGTTITLKKNSGANCIAYLYDMDGGITSLFGLTGGAQTITIPRSNTGVTIQADGVAEVEACFV